MQKLGKTLKKSTILLKRKFTAYYNASRWHRAFM
jgi:hypothetical protein